MPSTTSALASVVTSPTSAKLEMLAMTRRMIFPERVLGMSGTIQTFFGRATLPICVSIEALTFSSISGLAARPGWSATYISCTRPPTRWGAQGRGGVELVGPEPVTGDVDDVVDPAQYAVVAVVGLHGAVPAQERPVAPVLAGFVLAALGGIGLDE